MFSIKTKLCPRTVIFERPRPYRAIEDIGQLDADNPLKLGDFRGDPQSWHDFSFVNLNPKGICSISDQTANDGSSLEAFLVGQSMVHNQDFMSQAEDAIRFMAEECDQLGDFQMLADACGTYGGIATSIIDNILREEYDKKSVVTLGSFRICDNFEFQEIKPSAASLAMSLASFVEASDTFIPLMLNQNAEKTHLMFGEELHWTRALDASAMLGTVYDAFGTTKLGPSSWFLPRNSLADVGFSIPSFGSSEQFTSLNLFKETAFPNSKRITRINHDKDTYPSTLSPSDLPVYAPNFVYNGYQQQASSCILAFDDAGKDLSSWVKGHLLDPLRKHDFADLPDVEAQEYYTQVYETIATAINLDDEDSDKL
jgi:hypothetical protein